MLPEVVRSGPRCTSPPPPRKEKKPTEARREGRGKDCESGDKGRDGGNEQLERRGMCQQRDMVGWILFWGGITGMICMWRIQRTPKRGKGMVQAWS